MRFPAISQPTSANKKIAKVLCILQGHLKRIPRHFPSCVANTERAGEEPVAAAEPGIVIREAGVQDVESMAEIEQLTAGYWSAPEFVVKYHLSIHGAVQLCHSCHTASPYVPALRRICALLLFMARDDVRGKSKRRFSLRRGASAPTSKLICV